MAIQHTMTADEFTTALVSKLQRLDSIFDDITDLKAWLDGLSDQELADYFGGAISTQDANDIKSIVGVVVAAAATFNGHGNISLVRKAIGPGVIQR